MLNATGTQRNREVIGRSLTVRIRQQRGAGELSETAVDGKVVPFGLDNDKGTG